MGGGESGGRGSELGDERMGEERQRQRQEIEREGCRGWRWVERKMKRLRWWWSCATLEKLRREEQHVTTSLHPAGYRLLRVAVGDTLIQVPRRQQTSLKME